MKLSSWILFLWVVLAGSVLRAAPVQAESLRIGISGEVTSLDPHWNNSGPNIEVSLHLFEPLIATDKNGRLIPALATAWRNIDPLTWEISLRHGVKFQDGSDFTAQDVIFSIDRPNQLQGSPAPFTQFVKAITAKTIVDPYTIRIKTATPYVLLPFDLNAIFIVSNKVGAAATNGDFDNGKAAIGTGPYRLVSYQRGDRIELIRNDSYWGAKPTWDHVTLRLLSNNAARLSALMAGELDVIENIPSQDLPNLRANPKFTIAQTVSWRTLFWHMDQFRDVTPDVTDNDGKPLSKNPFKDPRVRQAVSQSINRQAIVDHVMEGLAVPASNLVSPGIFGHNDAIPVEVYDAAAAKKLLAEAGYPNGFMLTIHAPNNRYPNDARIAEATAGMLTRVGIRTKVVTLPWTAYLPRARAGEFTMAMVGWGSFLGDNTLKAHLATPNEAKGYGTWNFGRSSNPALDAGLDADFTIFDSAKREAATRDLMALGLRARPVIVMYHQMVSWAMRSGLHYPGRVDEFTLAQDFTH